MAHVAAPFETAVTQAMQAEDAICGLWLPTGHREHADDPPMENVPVGQG